MIDAALRSLSAALRAAVRCFRTDAAAPGALTRAVLFAGFFFAFGAWMALRTLLLATRRVVEVDAEVDLGSTSAPSWRVPCRLPDFIQTYLYLFGVWEPDLSEFIRSRLAPGDTYVDVGANVGAFVMLAADRVGTTGEVVAIEASASIAARLSATLSANVANHPAAKQVTIIVAAASDRRGTLQLTEGPAHNLGRTTTLEGATPGMVGRPAGSVASAPLGELIGERTVASVRLLKIDVEGAEPAVMRGVVALLPRLRRECEIVVELSPHWWPADEGSVASLLKPFLDDGFVAYELENDYWPWRYIWPRRVSRPRRLRGDLATLRRRVDLVLSRTDADCL